MKNKKEEKKTMRIPENLKLDVIQMNLLAIIQKKENAEAFEMLDRSKLYRPSNFDTLTQTHQNAILFHESNLLVAMQEMLRIDSYKENFPERVTESDIQRVADTFKSSFYVYKDIANQTREDKLNGIANVLENYLGKGFTKTEFEAFLDDAGIDEKTLVTVKEVTGKDFTMEGMEDRFLPELSERD